MSYLAREFYRTLPSLLYPLIFVGIAYFYSNEIVLLSLAYILGLIGARLFRTQHVLGYFGFRLAVLYEYLSVAVRKASIAFLLGAVTYLIAYYRGYSIYRLSDNATYIITFFTPILAAFTIEYFNYGPIRKRIRISIRTIIAIALASLAVRKVFGTLIERLQMPFGAAIGATIALYFDVGFSPAAYRILSFFLFGLLPLIVSLGLEARMLLAMKKID